MAGFLVILRNALSNLRSGHPHNWIGGRVIISIPSKDLNSKRALLDHLRLAGQSVSYDEAHKRWKAAAMTEVGILKEAFDLRLDCGLLNFRKIGGIRC